MAGAAFNHATQSEVSPPVPSPLPSLLKSSPFPFRFFKDPTKSLAPSFPFGSTLHSKMEN